jgi:hypothetical protein
LTKKFQNFFSREKLHKFFPKNFLKQISSFFSRKLSEKFRPFFLIKNSGIFFPIFFWDLFLGNFSRNTLVLLSPRKTLEYFSEKDYVKISIFFNFYPQEKLLNFFLKISLFFFWIWKTLVFQIGNLGLILSLRGSIYVYHMGYTFRALWNFLSTSWNYHNNFLVF